MRLLEHGRDFTPQDALLFVRRSPATEQMLAVFTLPDCATRREQPFGPRSSTYFEFVRLKSISPSRAKHWMRVAES